MRVNPLFVVIAGIYVVAGYGHQMAIAFIVVTLHELTHAGVADSFGLRVERIELWPFGGMAKISGLSSQEPYIEAMVAVAGPLQNFVLAACAWSFGRVLPLNPSWVSYFMEANLLIGALNLLPVAPLDGGRLAKIYLAHKFGHREGERRTREAGLWVARGIMALTVISFVVGRPLISVGVFSIFLYWGASKSGRMAPYLVVRDLDRRRRDFTARTILGLDDLAVRSDTPLYEVIKVMRPLKYHRVAVLDTEMIKLGILYEEEILSALTELGPDIPIGRLLNRR